MFILNNLQYAVFKINKISQLILKKKHKDKKIEKKNLKQLLNKLTK